MRVAVVALTGGGAATAARLASRLPGSNLNGDRSGAASRYRVEQVKVFLPEKLRSGNFAADYYDCPTGELLRRTFHDFQGLVLIMAAGIAVRSLAPLLQGKERDPAVVVMDERGQFAVSLLSGHLGGANDLARAVASVLGAVPVITTSTDVRGHLAVDVLARDLGVKLEPVKQLVAVNSAIARGSRIMLISQIPLPLGKDHQLWQDSCWQVDISREDLWLRAEAALAKGAIPVLLTCKQGPDRFLYLRPLSIVAGVGCRKGIAADEILKAVRDAFSLAGISPLSLRKTVSIEAKAHEEGILRAAAELRVETEFYPAETLSKILSQHQGLAQSEFVNTQMGVGGVCEPASLAGCRQGKLILGKQANQGVTVALAEEESGW